jgi:hypothetical protein
MVSPVLCVLLAWSFFLVVCAVIAVLGAVYIIISMLSIMYKLMCEFWVFISLFWFFAIAMSVITNHVQILQVA